MNKLIMEEQKEIILSIDEINNLTIDQLLDYRLNNVKINLDSDPKLSNPFNVRWNKDGLDISKEREDLIINTIQALKLRMDLENKGNKFYNDSLKNIFKVGEKINNKEILFNILDLNINDLKEEKDEKIDYENVGFKDIFNLITKVNRVNSKLATIGGKVDYVVDKLNITDITEYVFVILTIDALESED